jgi:Cu-Zn family superoxide dismutase
LTLVACGDSSRRDAAPEQDQPSMAQDSPPAAPASAAQATLIDSTGKELGNLTLTDSSQAIAVTGQLTGLPPGEHAIHLHTVGRCESPKFESAGDHWNPTNRQHGKDNPRGPHFGDLPNFTVSADRLVAVQVITPGGTLQGNTPLMDSDGAAVVVHAKRDDYKTQPSGDSGDRIACGVVNGQ